MRFDVGQRVHTPRGPALVMRHGNGTVNTSVGSFRETEVMSERDHEILKDPANIEAWLEGEFDEEVDGAEVELVDVICKCDCNRHQKRCHYLQHWEGGKVVFQSEHTKISTDCRCEQEECWCLSLG